ncbi:Hemolymph juvenile hormone binding protein [Operophtera brumata]|uniref:Hemolymph juvenile hormone binding protein n=1 Tax=Operophtera brumata TaxID=104452 RepID=A0A0L7L8U7_OPEBR|nr:Hemolymph juvenile hormone binding protein [Operophtera brumata]
MTFDIDISVPLLDIRADEYDLLGDLFTAIPLYGKGKASFVVEGFRFQARLFLKQSEDEKSILVDRVEEASFTIPSLKLTGVIGGGNIDAIVNAIVEEVLFDYIHRFRGAISLIAASIAPPALNTLLEQLDTWRFIAPLMPR